MDALMANEKEPNSPEWFTPAQFERRYNYARATASHKLRAMHIAGQLDKWKGRIPGQPGVAIKYRLKKAAAQ